MSELYPDEPQECETIRRNLRTDASELNDLRGARLHWREQLEEAEHEYAELSEKTRGLTALMREAEGDDPPGSQSPRSPKLPKLPRRLLTQAALILGRSAGGITFIVLSEALDRFADRVRELRDDIDRARRRRDDVDRQLGNRQEMWDRAARRFNELSCPRPRPIDVMFPSR